MNHEIVPTISGVQGYNQVIPSFIRSSQALDFKQTNRDFLPYLPSLPARVLDVGSGAGQNAAALANLGYSVVAFEPFIPFLKAAQSTYSRSKIQWIEDCLPGLESLGEKTPLFDFILVDGVWHHLDIEERDASLLRLSELLRPRGLIAISLRNGPAGAGTHLFPTDSRATIQFAKTIGFSAILHLENQPSLMPSKPNVVWSRIVLRKHSFKGS
ncbi:MAG: methyltransferase domain-containing protein [Verrucomicrobiota bacterium]